MRDTYRQVIMIVILLLVLVGVGTAVGEYSKTLPKLDSVGIASPQVGETISYQGQDGKTVLELLEQNHKVETTDSSIGKLVTSIDGQANTENSFWLYYVDGQQGAVAADEAQTKTGQTIEWRYETF